MAYKSRIVLAILTPIALVAVYFISPIVEALNSNSIDLESGSSQYLSIADANQAGLDLSDNLTLEAWVKFESFHASEATPLIFKRNASGGNRSYSFYVNKFEDDKLMDKRIEHMMYQNSPAPDKGPT